MILPTFRIRFSIRLALMVLHTIVKRCSKPIDTNYTLKNEGIVRCSYTAKTVMMPPQKDEASLPPCFSSSRHKTGSQNYSSPKRKEPIKKVVTQFPCPGDGAYSVDTGTRGWHRACSSTDTARIVYDSGSQGLACERSRGVVQPPKQVQPICAIASVKSGGNHHHPSL
jgi:hypothetical protein